MANPNVQRFNIREFGGLNLLDDARIRAQNSFLRLENIYRKAPGLLTTRPGSRLVARGDAANIQVPTVEAPDDTVIDPSGLGEALKDIALDSAAGLISDLEGRVTDLADINWGPFGGPRGIRTRALSKPVPPTGRRGGSSGAASLVQADLTLPVNQNGGGAGIHTVSVKPVRVAALHRMYSSFAGGSFLIGAWTLDSGYGDRLFWMDESGATPVLRVMAGAEMATGSGCTWQFISYYKEGSSASDRYYAIGTNGVGKPFGVKIVSGEPVFAPLDVVRSQSAGNVSDSTERLFAVNALCVFNGSVVYGGFKTGANDGSSGAEDFSHYICFSDPGEPNALAADDTIYSIRVGDSKFEPVTAVAVNSVQTDSQGIKGQLVVFTTRRVMIYDGLPPISGNPTGVNFQAVALSTVGCNAPSTIAQTPAGLCFLGSDGLVYLIPRFSAGGPIPVSRAIEPLLSNMTPKTQRFCAAVYNDGRYKLSFPSTTSAAGVFRSKAPSVVTVLNNGSPHAVTPNRQVWLDVRMPLQNGEMDFGLQWDGPHKGMKHSAFAIADQFSDHNVLFAGSAVDGSVFQAGIERYGADPDPDDVGTEVPISWDVWFGVQDGGDVHKDKTIRNFQFGFGTERTVEVQADLIVAGDIPGVEYGEQFVETAAPAAQPFSAFTTVGDLEFAPPEAFRLFSEFPTEPQRGTTFRFRFRGVPALPTTVRLSDLSFNVELHERVDRASS